MEETRSFYKQRPTYVRVLQLAVLSFVMYTLAVLPFFIKRGMPFFYYGDYNVQQIPFYIQAHRALRNGNLFWNWNVDLGTSMIGSFSFYLLGSPFFYLTFPFPESWIPYMMPFIMALKYAVCSVTAYLYIRKYVIRDESAMLGAILYAFSGFNACNIVFNHFTDVVAFFPLYLLTFDRLMDVDHHKDHWFYIPGGEKLIGFALMTTLMAVINYYFFFGQVVFLLIYFIVRYVPGNRFRTILRMMGRALFGGVCGVLIGAFYVLQAALSVSGNDRLGNVLNGYDLVSYPSMNMLWDILKSMVMIPDIIGKGTVFYTGTVRVSSLAVYLPVFGLTGVIAYFLQKSKNGRIFRRLLLTCLIIAAIPGLNACFSLLNEDYYCRWYYMPILFMSLMTAIMVERGSGTALKRGVLINSALFVLILLISIFPAYDSSGNLLDFGMIENQKFYIRQIIGTAATLILLIAIIYFVPKRMDRIKLPKGRVIPFKKPLMKMKIILCLTVIGAVTSTHIVLINGSSLISDYGKQEWQNQMLEFVPELQGDEFYRDETDNTATNYDMVWGIGSLHSFISTIPAETFNFLYGAANISRSVETKIPRENIGLRAITSAKYYIENSRINDDGIFETGEGIEGYQYDNTQNGFDIYLNRNYIKMGFAYDYYITESDFDDIENEDTKDRILSVAVVLDDSDADEISGLKELPASYYKDTMPLDIFAENCADRNETSCETFETSTKGFYARTTNLDSRKMVFFSVPFSKGFTLTVDGEKAETYKATYGMIGVMVDPGVHEIRADYVPDGFRPGMILSFAGALMLLAYIIFYRMKERAVE